MTTTDQSKTENPFLQKIDQELLKVRPYHGWDFKRSGSEIFYGATPVCTLFRVKAIASAEDHSDTSFIIEVLTPKGTLQEAIVPNGLLIENASKAIAIMGKRGGKMRADPKVIKHLILDWPTRAPQTLATHLGWHNRDFFVLATGEVLTAPEYRGRCCLFSKGNGSSLRVA